MNAIEEALKELQKQVDLIEDIREKGLLSSEFKVWHNKCISIINELFGTESSHAYSFRGIAYLPPEKSLRVPEGFKKSFFLSALDQAKKIIVSCINFAQTKYKLLNNSTQKSIQLIENLCNRFPRTARQICTDYRGRSISIKDEYDVQHFLHALLMSQFDDIRAEEWNPSYAGAASRVDFLLKREKIVIEVKKTREGLKDKEVGEQLIVDIKKYSQNQNCETLICFVYEPERLIFNPDGLESDLSGRHDNISVKVIIAPKE